MLSRNKKQGRKVKETWVGGSILLIFTNIYLIVSESDRKEFSFASR